MYGVSDVVACQGRPLRASRANRIFCTDEKHLRPENAVIDKSSIHLGLFLPKFATLQQR
jgi:hypothetical protein